MIREELHVYDCIGVGFGPSNMALAIALEEKGILENCLFVEAQEDFSWHSGMLLDGTDIQHNPLRDLVTPRNPSSPYGFLAYLKAAGRLFEFLNLSAPYPPRSEYAAYVNWVGRQFKDYVFLNTRLVEMRYTTGPNGLPVVALILNDGRRLIARTVSFAPGRSNYLPPLFQGILGADIVHLSNYRYARDRWMRRKKHPRIAVVGGSQSAIEILLDLAHSARVTSICRGFGFKQKDLSAFTEQIYYPSFVDTFFAAEERMQGQITSELWRSNYGASDHDLIQSLNFKLYEQHVQDRKDIEILHNTEIIDVDQVGDVYRLTLSNRLDSKTQKLEVDGVVLATGFRNFGGAENQEPYHPLMEGLAEELTMRSDGGVVVDRDYRLGTKTKHDKAPVYVNGLSETSHGFGDAGSFSLLSVRSELIAQSIIGHLMNPGTSDLGGVARELNNV